MLYLILQLGTDSYALDAQHAIEVLPAIDLKPVPRAPASMAGVLNYHGDSVPVLDLAEIILGRRSIPKMNTRIIITRHEYSSGSKQFLGLLAEHTTDMFRGELSDFVPSGVTVERAAYLGPVIVKAGQFVQRLEIEHLLDFSDREQLFSRLMGPSE